MALNLFGKRNNNKIGIAITPSHINAISVKREKNQIVVNNYVQRAFEGETIKSGALINPEFLEKELMELSKLEGFESGDTTISLPSNTSFIKTITLPEMPEEELAMIIPQEAKKHIPIPIDDLNIDYEIARYKKDPGGIMKEMEVVLVALSKIIAKTYIDCFNNTGFEVNAIDVSSFAVIRTLAENKEIDDSEKFNISILIGEENTDISVINKGMPVFLNNIPIGNNSIIDSLESSLDISRKEAQNLLPKISLAVPGVEVESDQELVKAGTAARSTFNDISGEIYKIVEFYSTQMPINKVFVSSSGVYIKNTEKFLANRLKINTVLSQPFVNLKIAVENIEMKNQNEENSVYTTSLGLALKG